MKLSLKPIEEQVMVITGASSGIGLATAQSAVRHGARVVLAARSEQTLDEIVTRLDTTGGEAMYCVCDVANRDDVERIGHVAVERVGRTDTWINDSGISIHSELAEVSEQDNRRLFDANFWGVVNGSLAALPHLKRQGGALINVGSEWSEAVVPLQDSSRHAVKGFTDALRDKVAKVDDAPISITLIEPTAVDTPFPVHGRSDTRREPGRPPPMIDPEKVADAILHAASHPERDAAIF